LSSLSFKLGELAKIVGGDVEGDADVEIVGVAGIREAKDGDITFVANPKYETFLDSTLASAVIGSPTLACNRPILRIENPYLAYLKVLNLFAEELTPKYPREVHEAAVVESDARLGENVAVGPFCQVCSEVSIGDNTTVLAGTFIGQDVRIGRDCLIYPNVTIREGCRIGDRVIIQPGAVIGADGFGFAKDGQTHHKVPQIGRVILEDDVEIGANTTVDRATTGDTVVKRGSKIDNLVQIAHNVVVGEDSILAAQAGIAGSTELGQNVVLGGQAGLVGHITIGDGAMVGAQGGVTKSVPPNTAVSGYPAREHKKARRLWAMTNRLPELLDRIKELERKIELLEEGKSVDSSAEIDKSGD
jgi:UDP-3-O-[3-hydroxymyristoyl] glucosamine N-acyltransferase